LKMVALCFVAIVGVNVAMAQVPKPKPPKADKPAVKKPEKAKPVEKKPVEKKAKEAEAKPDAEKPSAKPAPPDDPAVAAILATKPNTPEECIRAAKILAELNRADLAKGFIQKVLDAKLDPQQLADLGQQIGSPVFLELSDRSALLPEAKQLADVVTAAVTARVKDAKRIAGLIKQLQDPSPEKRLRALVGLQEAGEAAIDPLLAVLADPARAPEHDNVRAALAEMGRIARGPLVAIVEQADPKLAVQAVETLGAMKDAKNTEVVPSLLRPCLSEKSDPALREAATEALKELGVSVPSRAEAVRLLTDAAKSYFERRNKAEGNADEKAMLWRWDEAKRQCVAKTCTPGDVVRTIALRRARDAYELAPNEPLVGSLCLAAALEAAAYENGLDRPLDDKNPAVVEARQSGDKMIEEVLKYAAAHERFAAAAAAARILGEIGKATGLLYRDAGPSPLVLAARSPDRRLRMAALEAIVRLQPAQPFAGSSYVPQALGFFAASSGFRHALVACPNLAEARELAGVLSAAGLQADTFTNGKELLLWAARSPDCELAMIDVTIDHPVIGMLLQQLRHDPRTASLRVGLIARHGHLDQAERLVGLDPLAKAFVRPYDDKASRWQFDQLAALAPDAFVGLEARQRQAALALDLLAELNRSSGKLYDLRGVQDYVIAAVYNPKLAAKAVEVLAVINSTESQRTLVEVASRFTLPLALRQAAAKAFRQNTQKHGILLTTEEIRRQYQRYNESEKLDAATQHVLALILDCLEVGVPKKK